MPLQPSEQTAFNTSTMCPKMVDILPATYIVTLTFTALFPVLQLAMILHFMWYRSSSVLLRKRPLLLILISCVGCNCLVMAAMLPELIHDMPCFVRAGLGNASIPLMLAPLIIRVSQYRAAVLYTQNVTALRRNTSSSGASSTGNNGRLLSNEATNCCCGLTSCSFAVRGGGLHKNKKTCFSGFYAFTQSHLLRPHKRKPANSFHIEAAEVEALQWSTGPFFVCFWITVALVPFIVYYFTRLAMEISWRMCGACRVDMVGFIFRMVMVGILLIFGTAVGYTLKRKADPLNVVLEMQLVFYCGELFSALGLILRFVDPWQLQQRGYVIWRWFDLLAGTLILFFQTSFHILWLRYSRLSRKHLDLTHFHSEDVLQEIRGNPRLMPLLREHMQQELSYENLLFIEEVERWRQDFKNRKDNVQRTARRIYQTYVNNKGDEPVNISDHARQRAELLCLRGNVPSAVFDEALREVYDLVLMDTLPRFLASKSFRDESRQRRATAGFRTGGKEGAPSPALHLLVSAAEVPLTEKPTTLNANAVDQPAIESVNASTPPLPILPSSAVVVPHSTPTSSALQLD